MMQLRKYSQKTCNQSATQNKSKWNPNAEGSSVLGLQWTVTDDSLQVCREAPKKEVEAPITQRKIQSLVSSVFDPIELFAPFSVHMRRLLKGI